MGIYDGQVKRAFVVVTVLALAVGLFLTFYSSEFSLRISRNAADSLYHYRDPFFRPNSPKTNDACLNLHQIARNMLNGERIELPFETRKTRWKFHDEKDLDLLGKTSLKWNYEKKMSNKTLQFINIYNNAKTKDIRGKKYFITFAHKCCERSKMKAIMCALYPGGFDDVKIHTMDSLTNGFKKTHGYILNQTRGGGYWLWKPYVILKTLVEILRDGDMVMYQDSGAYLIGDAGPLLKLCEDLKFGILLFYVTLLEKHYTKRDSFILMEMDDIRVHKTFQRSASFLVIHKNCKSLQFVMEWLAYASHPQIVTDDDNKIGKENLPGFREHRHDQSVLSLLSKRWGLYAFRTPSQYGNELGYSGGPYKQIIFHSRDRT